ncbi:MULTISPECIES: energy transducer TonB [unclassified Synechocystis]|uniref:energy transducer TonB family protein n=1 Tax=unclassified Synechocystis TaxID=2640012 RepID=UPI00068F3A61|nr:MULTISPECIES: energy transducer TonB [unclassified Synechocystis]MCT0254207.1 TonB family protein [Synechocystis sp. CS-94]
MSMSPFCLTQRSQQYQNSQKIILVGSACSLLVHGAIVGFWRFPLPAEAPTVEPIEFIVVDPSPALEPTPPPLTKPKVESLPKISPPPPQATSSPIAATVSPPLQQAITPPPPTVNPVPNRVVENPVPLPELPLPAPSTPIAEAVSPPLPQAITPPLATVKPLPNTVVESPASLTRAPQSTVRVPFTAVETPEFAPIPEQPAFAAVGARPTIPQSLANSSAPQPVLSRPGAAASPQSNAAANQGLFSAIANINPVSQGAAPIKPGTATKPIASSGNQSRPKLGSGQGTTERPGDRNSGQNVGPIAANPVASSAPPRPPATPNPPAKPEPLRCISQCRPSYPSALQGEEGSAKVLVSVDNGGNVTSVTITDAHANGEVNRQALLAARQMKFTAPTGGQSKSVPVVIHFTVAGSDFDRQARERRQQQEELRQAARRAEEEKANQARQRQLEQERQARQRQLEKEREERLRQLSVESAPSPAAKPSPPPIPEVKPSSPPSPKVESSPPPAPSIEPEVQSENSNSDAPAEL